MGKQTTNDIKNKAYTSKLISTHAGQEIQQRLGTSLESKMHFIQSPVTSVWQT